MRGSDSAFPQFKAELSRGHMESPRQLRCEPAACAAFGGGGGDYPVRRRTAGVHNAIAAQSSGAELVGTSPLSLRSHERLGSSTAQLRPARALSPNFAEVATEAAAIDKQLGDEAAVQIDPHRSATGSSAFSLAQHGPTPLRNFLSGFPGAAGRSAPRSVARQ
jgi:hypothetical protein